MKRIRRVSVEIEHREVTFSLTRSQSAPGTAAQEAAAQESTEETSAAKPDDQPSETTGLATRAAGTSSTGTPAASTLPAVCPVCGAAWVFVVASLSERFSASARALHHALRECGLHLHVSAAGQLRICSKSFEAIKEKL